MTFVTVDGMDYILNVISGREPVLDTYHVALCYEEPGITTDGTELTEPLVASYFRAPLENVSGNWDVIHGQLSNVIPVDFPLADEDWDVIRYWAVCDAAQEGRVLWAGEMIEETFVGEGDQPSIPQYGITIWFGTQA